MKCIATKADESPCTKKSVWVGRCEDHKSESGIEEDEKDWPAWVNEFLERIAVVPFIHQAARETGVEEDIVVALFESDHRFRRACEDHMARAFEDLEGNLFDRMKNGWQEPVFEDGKEVGTKTVYDNRSTLQYLEIECPGSCSRIIERMKNAIDGDRPAETE